MRREHSTPRTGWQHTIEQQGLVYHRSCHPSDAPRPYWDESVHYVFSMAEVLALEEQVEELHRMCLAAVQYVIDNKRLNDFAIPDWAQQAVIESWRRRDPYVFGRFDLRYDGSSPATMLEYNADTPTSLLESSIIQWFWQQDVYPDDDQWNSIHEALVARWQMLPISERTHFTWTLEDATGEEVMTVAYLQETAELAGRKCRSVGIEDIGWHTEKRHFVDLEHDEITQLVKLYPWEWLIADQFGRNIVERGDRMHWYEPLWKMLLSNKALLAVLWEIYPGHPNLAPAYLHSPRDLTHYIAKPLLGREGANMRIITPDWTTSTPGEYGLEGFVYQEFRPLPDFAGQHPVLGAWVVGDESVGIGIRETTGLITDDTSSFVPHRINEENHP